jgi:hypothetical protein
MQGRKCRGANRNIPKMFKIMLSCWAWLQPKEIGGIIMNKTVFKEKRVLLIVNCLAEHGDQRLRFLYQFIESAGVETARRLLERHYRQISVLRDREATHAAFLDRLKTLAEDKTIDAIDLFLQLHGEPGKVQFHDHWVSTMRLREEIKRAAGRDCLRLVYNTSCYGDTHSDDLLKAGFKVSIGALKGECQRCC